MKELLNPITKTSKVYNGGLTLEEEPHTETTTNNLTSFSHKFAGTIITGTLDATNFKCKTLNDNWEHIRCIGEQKKARYPPAESYIHDRIKTGMIIGSLKRMKTQNSTTKDLNKSIREFLLELKMIGYNKTTTPGYQTQPRMDNPYIKSFNVCQTLPR